MFRFATLWIAASLGLAGCTPTHDWRIISSDEYRWSAMFPGKPVEVTRTIRLTDIQEPIRLTLRSTKIKNSMFAVGWVVNDGPSIGNDKNPSPITAERIRAALEKSMLQNLQHEQSSAQRSVIRQAQHTMHDLRAKGAMQLDQGTASRPARLWMRSIALPNAAVLAIEILAVGPRDELSDEIALQFIESLKLR